MKTPTANPAHCAIAALFGEREARTLTQPLTNDEHCPACGAILPTDGACDHCAATIDEDAYDAACEARSYGEAPADDDEPEPAPRIRMQPAYVVRSGDEYLYQAPYGPEWTDSRERAHVYTSREWAEHDRVFAGGERVEYHHTAYRFNAQDTADAIALLQRASIACVHIREANAMTQHARERFNAEIRAYLRAQ